MAKNWSNYDGGQRGLLFGLVALDFISSVFIYLMVVVKYRFWPDAARTVILIGVHAAGATSFMIYGPSFPCKAFGSAICDRMTVAIITGSLVILSLLTLYGISLPLMVVFSPQIPPEPEDDLEETPRPKIEEEPVLQKRKSHASSGSRAWLLKNQEGMSPELNPSVLPRPLVPGASRGHSHTSSSLSSLNLPQPTSHLMHEVGVEGYRSQPGTPKFEPRHFESSPRSSGARAVRAPLISAADKELNVSGSSSASSMGDPPSRASSPDILPLPNRFREELTDDNGVSLASTSSNGSTATRPENPIVTRVISETPRRSETFTIASSSSASVYSQPSASSHLMSATEVRFDGQRVAKDNRGTPLSGSQSSLPRSAGQDSFQSVMADVHDALDQVNELEIPAEGFLSPPLTALPSPGVPAGSAQTTFELHLSDSPQQATADAPIYITGGMDKQHDRMRQDSLATIMPPPPRPRTHVRNDSVGSNVDMDEWRRLVMSAAGKDR
ncbi:hypothetical protein F5I97DRAFT_497060 [Phlebopus sp. FC_14]|nr:hypothetical protein F5I97DRAFT_497060 [Phlebopus sp. FC_14]